MACCIPVGLPEGKTVCLVSHLVSWVSSCVACLVFWLGVGFWLCCLGFVWLFALTYSPTCGNSQSKTIRFDDRQSLERARHEHKKKRSRGFLCRTLPSVELRMFPSLGVSDLNTLVDSLLRQMHLMPLT